MMGLIARREARALFLSPLAWALLAVNQLVLGWIFLRVVERFTGLEATQRAGGVTLELSLNLFSFAAVLALFSTPLLATRLFTEDLRSGSYRLLRAAPVSLAAILLGKYLALGALLAALVLLPLLMAGSLWTATPLDWGLLASAALGLGLVNGYFAAVATFAATLSAQPAVSVTAGYGLLLLLSVMSQSGALGGEEAVGLLRWLSWNEHLLPFLLGMVRASDLFYFLGGTLVFLLLALRQLENRDLR